MFIVIAAIIFTICYESWVTQKKNQYADDYNNLQEKYRERERYYQTYGVKSGDKYYMIVEQKLYVLLPILPLEDYIRNNTSLPSKISEKVFISDIKYYQMEGSKRKEQYISGGGSSLSGAIVGDIIAGDVGAVIGSRKKTKTDYKEIDDRTLLVTLYDNTEINLDYNCYEYFLDVIPELDYENYMYNKKNKGKIL